MKKGIKKIKWCDLTCEHAEFPKNDALSGDCRTLSTLYCVKHHILVQKNSRCLDTVNSKKSK